MLEELYKEGLGCVVTAKFSTKDSHSVLYKGFKITKNLEDNSYLIQDIRTNDFYTQVKESDLRIISDNGLIVGCDLIMLARDSTRVKTYTKKLEDSYKNKTLFEKDPVKNEKRLRNCISNIADYIDLLFFYKSRLIQNTSKYE